MCACVARDAIQKKGRTFKLKGGKGEGERGKGGGWHARVALFMLASPPIYTHVVAVGAVAVGVYACVLYQRKLQLRRHQMYMDTFLKALDTMMRMKRLRTG